MFRMTAKEGVFFDLFVDTAEDTCKAAKMLNELMENYVDVNNKIRAIEELEHKCDGHVHKMMEHLNRSFITPIDREDIYLIAKEIDNITDYIESTAHRFRMFNVADIKEDAKKLSRLIIQCTEELMCVMSELRRMKTSKILKEKIIEVNRIEDEADDIFRSAVQDLFVSETNAIEVLKWKEIYEYLENTLDACEDVANIVEGVVMKNS
jgi:predicted phosphate transport protein (TIGR00153 family)